MNEGNFMPFFLYVLSIGAPKPTDTQAPSSTGATATVTTATIHTVPPITPPLLIPPPGAAPVHLTAPFNPATQEPNSAPVLQVPETQQVQQVPSSASAPTPELVSQAEITLLVTEPSQAAPDMPSSIQLKVPTHTGEAVTRAPVLNALDAPGVTITSSAGESPISTSGAQASISNTPQIQLTRPCSSSQSSGNIQVQTEVKDMGTSEKFPVQDTNPQLRQERTFQGPEEMSDPTANEVVQRHNGVGLAVSNAQTNSNRATQATTSTPTEVVAHAPHSIEQEYFSKPGTLQISEPQQNRAGTLPVLQEDPCSLVSGDLEISRETASSTDSRQVTSLAEQTSTSSTSTPLLNNPPYTSALLTNNQPEEDHYESVCENQTLRHVFHVAEEPPAENLNGQPPIMMLHSRVNSEEPPTINHVGTENVAHVCVPSVDVAETSDHKSTTVIAREQECNAAAAATIQQPEQREEGRPELFRINNVHAVAAAGIALSAVFLAWKLNH
ncbi:mitochondrial antiviral-signaling protein [Danio aesculapii]|uniref:mitochondrial antiviral-signaling protein n=1 Tax=Danio aesculapii TaxID=1142201 RepID=UPI0024BFDF35|nr:mitochondrial antiviral-signaling protein [Danio aesculapii]